MNRRSLAFMALAWVAACGEGGGNAMQDAASSRGVGQQAPDYGAVTVEGDSIELADLRGEVVLLNVWATWCAPCRQEIPELEAIHEALSDQGLRVVGVSVDSPAARDQVLQFIADFDMTYDIWLDPSQDVVSAFEAVGVPLTVLLDRQGRIAWRRLGVLQREDPGLHAATDSLLAT